MADSKRLPRKYNLHDDLCVFGADDREHNENLERVVHKLEESGLTLNYKCEIGVSSMTYMGVVLSGKELKVSSDRVKAIVEAPAPQNQSELRSVQFCAKFIQVKRFCEIKDRLTRAPVMAYDRQGAETRLITDAAPVGVGAILEHKQEDGT